MPRLLTPVEVEVDVFGQAAALRLTRHAPTEVGGHRPDPDQGPGEEVVLPARTILVAAGTQPNTVLGARGPRPYRARRPLFPRARRGRQPGDARSGSPSPRRCGC